ncbi:HECT-domain protein [Trichinella nativa]|uniref:E3 ubiquitin-protein ligase n=1 Tax=Trichinella nativa TaxID=6335 RepID=A0A1Y3EI30_9BILA|nr:HECT-domain protein [Trichinella nativa]
MDKSSRPPKRLSKSSRVQVGRPVADRAESNLESEQTSSIKPIRKKAKIQQTTEQSGENSKNGASGSRTGPSSSSASLSSAGESSRSLADLVDYFPSHSTCEMMIKLELIKNGEVCGRLTFAKLAVVNKCDRRNCEAVASSRLSNRQAQAQSASHTSKTDLNEMESNSRSQGGKKKGKAQKPNATKSGHATSSAASDANNSGNTSDPNFNTDLRTSYASILGTFGPRVTNLLLRGSSSGNERIESLLSSMQKHEDSSTQLQALIELCNILVMSNEETLGSNFPFKELIRVLTRLLQTEHNFDIMTHACRALTYLMEASPRIGSALMDAVPCLLSKLQRVECIDVAEQALTALELLSRRLGKNILNANGIECCLMFIDFFPLASQRSALHIVSNCCYHLTEKDFDYLANSLPILTQRLKSQDKKTVELMCVTFARLVENLIHSPDKIQKICEHGLLSNIQQMLIAVPPVISSGTLVNVIRMMHLICRSCPTLTVSLVSSSFVFILRFLLTGSTEEKSESRELLSRTPQEMYELVLLIGELLPSLPTEGLFEVDSLLQPHGNIGDAATWSFKDERGVWRSYSHSDSRVLELAYQTKEEEISLSILGQSYVIDLIQMTQICEETGSSLPIQRKPKEINAQILFLVCFSGTSNANVITPENDPRVVLLKDAPIHYEEIVQSIFPLLYDIYSSVGGSAVRHECLRCFLKMIYHGNVKMIDRILETVPISNLIAGLLCSHDFKSIVCALQLAKVLLEKKRKYFTVCFQREGVTNHLKNLSVHLKQANAFTIAYGDTADLSARFGLQMAGSGIAGAAAAPGGGSSSFTGFSTAPNYSPMLESLMMNGARVIPFGGSGRNLSLSFPFFGSPSSGSGSSQRRVSLNSLFGFASGTLGSRATSPTFSLSEQLEASAANTAMALAGASSSAAVGVAGSLFNYTADDIHLIQAAGSSLAKSSTPGFSSGEVRSNPRGGSPLRKTVSTGRGSGNFLGSIGLHRWNTRSGFGALKPPTPPLSSSNTEFLSSHANYWKSISDKVSAWAEVTAKALLDDYFKEGDGSGVANYYGQATAKKLCEIAQKFAEKADEGFDDLVEVLHSDVTCYELLQSGLIEELSKYLTQGNWQHALPNRLRLFCSKLFGVRVKTPTESEVPEVFIEDEESGKRLITMLVMCISQLEQFPVKTHDLSWGQSGGGLRGLNAFRFLHSQQIKCQPVRHPSETKLRQWKRGVIKVDPLCPISTIERYLILKGYGKPKTNPGDDDSSNDEEDGTELTEDDAEALLNVASIANGVHRLQLLIHDRVLPYDMTIFQALRQYGGKSSNVTSDGLVVSEWIGPDMWMATNRIAYRLLPENDTSGGGGGGSAGSSKEAASTSGVSGSCGASSTTGAGTSRGRRGGKGSGGGKKRSPTAASNATPVYKEPENILLAQLKQPMNVTTYDPCLKALGLLRVVFSIARYWWILYEKSALVRCSAPLVPLTAFHVSKIAAKISRQLQDPLIILSDHLPYWVEQVAYHCPFILPFDVRRSLFNVVALDHDRALQHLLESAGESSSYNSADRLAPRLERRKVCIPRQNILKQAETVFNNMNHSRAVLEVQYENEVGSGLGPTLEFYALVSHNLQRADLHLWRGTVNRDRPLAEGVNEYIHSDTGLFPDLLNPGNSEEVIRRFRLCGKLLSRALLDGRVLDIPLNVLFFKWLLQEEKFLCATDFNDLDPAFAASMHFLKTLLLKGRLGSEESRERVRAEIEDMQIDFVVPGRENVELKPGGKNIALTLENLSEYIDLVAFWMLHAGVVRQMDALRESFGSIIQLKCLKMFLPEEVGSKLCTREIHLGPMELLISGCNDSTDTWEVQSLLQAIHPDHGYTPESPQIRWLAEIMSNYTLKERRDFLQFLIGSPRLPVGGLKHLNPPFTVVRKLCDCGNTDKLLPSVMTCVNYLKLPEYSDRELMRERIRTAVEYGRYAFHLS